MIGKKINELATELAPATSDLTIIGNPTTGVSKKITLLQIANLFATTGTVSSVAVTETGTALSITGSPITSSGTINIGFAGSANQYVRGDGALADFPIQTGGGSSVSYYLNSSVSQGTLGGVSYRQLSKNPISGAGTDISISANGYIASYITDANDPALLEVPGGNFSCELYFSVNSNNHNPYVYAEVYKYDGTTFTLLGSSQTVPEYLTNGSTLSPYYFAIPVTATALTITDRIAIRIYANVDTRTVTLHTENSHLCQIVTTFSKGLTSLNNLTRQVQYFGIGTSGTDFNISSATATHTFNLPTASASNRGALSSTDWTTFNNKQNALTNPVTGTGASGQVTYFNGTTSVTGTNSFFWDATNSRLGIGLLNPQRSLEIYNSTADAHLRLSGTAPTVSMGEAVTGAIYQAKFGLVTANGQFVTGAVAGDFIMLSQTGATIFATSSTEKMRISGTGNVSIGNTNNTYKLEVTGTTNITGQLTLGSTITNGTYTYTLPGATGTLALTSAIPANPVGGTGTTNYLSKFTAASTIGNSSIFDNGNVAIGSASPVSIGSYKTLLIQGGNTSNGGLIQLQNSDSTCQAYWFTTNNSSILKTITNHPTIFGANNTDYLYITGAGNVGIGTASPTSKLSVIGSSDIRSATGASGTGYALEMNTSSSTPRIDLVDNGTYTGALKTNANVVILANNSNNALAFQTNGTERARFTAAGLLGIGTTTPNSAINVSGINVNAAIDWTNTTATTGRTYRWVSTNSGAFAIEDITSGGERARITSAGNFGIGTTSPSYALDVAGSINVSANNFFRYNGDTGIIGSATSIGGANTQLGIRAASDILFATNGANERMRITSGGNVGIGTTNPLDNLVVSNAGANTLHFDVTFSSGASLIYSYNRSTSAYTNLILQGLNTIFKQGTTEYGRFASGGSLLLGITSTFTNGRLQIENQTGTQTALALRAQATTGSSVAEFYNPNGQVGSIQTSGTATSYVTSSDYRLKQDLKDYNGLDLINKIKTYDYEWKADKTRSYGVVAHELQSIINYAVIGDKDGQVMQGVDYSKIVPILVKAIQELNDKIK